MGDDIKYRVAIIASVCAACAALPTLAYASAGGGVGGMGGFGGMGRASLTGAAPPWEFWGVVAAIGGMVWMFITGFYHLKALLVRRALTRVGRGESVWTRSHIEDRARSVFTHVQQAWAENHLRRARTSMSDDLLECLAAKLEAMHEGHRRNVMVDLRFRRAAVVGVSAPADPARDKVWVWIDATLTDYIVDTTSGLLVDGNAMAPRRLREVWTFVPGPKGWVVDHIEQHPHGVTTLFLPQTVDGSRRA